MAPSIALLKAQDYEEWNGLRALGRVAGSVGPYSVDLLEEHGFEVRWSDATYRSLWSNSLVERLLGRLGREVPELTGIRNALANRGLIRRSSITLGIFEDQGAFAAFARSHRMWMLAPRRMVLMVCWMAEWAEHASPRVLRAYRRVLAGADLVVFFSRNQAEVLEGTLGVDPARLLAVPFGVDVEFFAGAPVRDEGYVLAIGGDTSRDHELLVQAVTGTDIATRIYAPRLNSETLPSNVTWISRPISHLEYREALAGAKMVVIPTFATRYPGGQTVVLEAMAASKPVITTASEAMGEYVKDGVNGLLVPRGDARALRSAIERLACDDALRRSLAAHGRELVGREFTQAVMWGRIAPRMRSLLES